MNHVSVTGIGSYIPDQKLTNQDLEKFMDTSDEWIFSRTGMKERPVLEPESSTAEMGVKSAQKALKMANLTPQDIDMIVVGTSTPEYIFPSTATQVQRILGCREGIPAFDVSAACSSLVYVMIIGSQFITNGVMKNVLVIGTDAMTRVLDYGDRSTAILFADGASAVILSATSNKGVLSFDFGANGYTNPDLLKLPLFLNHSARYQAETQTMPKPSLVMNGQEIYKNAIHYMILTLENSLKKAGITQQDLAYIIPHQANSRILKAIANRLDLPTERVADTVAIHANTSGATVGIALDILFSEGKIQDGDKIALIGFGGGLTWASLIFEYHKS